MEVLSGLRAGETVVVDGAFLLKAQAENKVNATLTSAVAVDKGVADQVARSLEKKLGRKVELTLTVDASLIGGAVIRAENLVIDGSVRSRLEKLAHALVS